MNITFTKEELEQFAIKLDRWNTDRAMVVIDLAIKGRIREGNSEIAKAALLAFEQENPKPDWRSLL